MSDEERLTASPAARFVSEWTREPPEPWMDDALCAQTDPEAFFPEKGESPREAKKVCASCEVAQQCLDYALARNELFGIWGGTSAKQRRRLRPHDASKVAGGVASAAARRAREVAA